MTPRTRKSILIADDDAELLQSISVRLKRLGCAVWKSPDSAHALMGAMRMKPDLIILDVNMPNGNGLAVAEMLAGNEECRHIPIIIHTGLNEPATIARCIQNKARYIRKSPGSPEQIVDAVQSMLQLPKSNKAHSLVEEEPLTEIEMHEEFLSEISQNHITEHQAEFSTSHAALTVCEEELCQADTPSISEHRPLILSIDDDPDVCLGLELKLKPYGFDVIGAFNGEQGCELANELNPDLIITDLVLPEAEGAYIVRQLRSNPELSKTPIIVITGQSYVTIRQQILGMGVDAFLTKPISTKVLVREIRQLIPVPHLEPEELDKVEAETIQHVFESITSFQTCSTI
ncbi:MAG: response regulator [Planctomycetaceae bacterium]